MQRVAALRLTSYFLLIGAISLTVSSRSFAAAPEDVAQLTAALDELDQWLGPEANGEKWRKYLGSRALRAQVAKGREADPAVVSRVLEQYRSGATGLDKKRFRAVRREIESWRAALKQQYTDDLPKLAWASRGDYQPASKAERLAASRAQLRQAAQALEKSLGTNTQFAENWKRYLRWERLEPHLSGDVSIDNQTLADLTAVLRRFRSNANGLEISVFTQAANALEHHRGLLRWYHLVEEYARRSRKKYSARDLERRVYMSQLLELEKQLTRHLEVPTLETSRKVGQLLGLVQLLEQSPQLVHAIQTNFSQPNVFTEVSESAINRLAQRSVQDTQPVRDVILGVRIRGTAKTNGLLTIRTLPASDHVALELQLAGNIRSSTIGHKKPVRITSRSSTDFVATKLLHISDDRFVALPADAKAHTKTKVRSVKKTGGRFGRKLIERVAWKKVGKSKTLGERIASQRAGRKVAKKFDNQVDVAIFEARHNYDQKARPPLVRVGMFPEHLQMASTDHSVTIEATLVSHSQLSTGTTPISTTVDHDLSVRVHETAVNNLLPTILAGVGIKQEKESEAPTLLGDFPSWLNELAKKHGGKPASDPVNEEAASEFKPFSVTLNRSHPLSVRFDDQQLKLRIRIAELKTIEEGEEKIRENWDLVLTFQIIQDGDSIVLRRIGDIEAFPTGFDPNPRWGDKLTGEQAATRGVLAKVLKKRADGENGFPKEITLPPIQFALPEDVEHTLVLQHLDCDDGWLTIGYQLP